MPTWSEAERTAIFVMATDYDLDWEEIHEIFGRMFALGSDRQYTVSHIRDEVGQATGLEDFAIANDPTVQAALSRGQVEDVVED